MAFPPYSYKANEPSLLETKLSELATNPATAGAAMQLLPGATANREAASDSYNQQIARDQLLAQMTQQETARHQQSGDASTTLALSQPGAAQIAMSLPVNQPIFGGMTPQQTNLVSLNTQGQFRQQDANIVDKYADAQLKGVQSGNTTPPDVASAQMGYNLVQQSPLQMQIERMKEQHSDARAAAKNASDAQTLKVPTWSYNPDTHTVAPTALRPGPGFFENIAATDAFNARLKNPVIDKDTGQVVPPDASTLPGVVGQTVGRKNNMPTGTVQLGGRSAAGDAGKLLPAAKGETSAPPAPSGGGGGGQLTTAPAPAGGDATLTQLVTRVGGAMGAKLQQMKDSGDLRFAKDANNQYWIVAPGLKPIGPLPPR